MPSIRRILVIALVIVIAALLVSFLLNILTDSRSQDAYVAGSSFLLAMQSRDYDLGFSQLDKTLQFVMEDPSGLQSWAERNNFLPSGYTILSRKFIVRDVEITALLTIPKSGVVTYLILLRRDSSGLWKIVSINKQ